MSTSVKINGVSEQKLSGLKLARLKLSRLKLSWLKDIKTKMALLQGLVLTSVKINGVFEVTYLDLSFK